MTRTLQTTIQDYVRKLVRRPPSATVEMGSLRRTQPFSRNWGFDRGKPIDRYYIEAFLEASRRDIRGRVLEVANRVYTTRYGGDAVTRSDVLHISGNDEATIIGDLTTGDGIPADSFDCLVITQTLHVIYNVKGAISTIYRALRPGGVVLATFPGISQICREDMDLWGDYWRFTTLSARLLFETQFPPENITVASAGNVLAATAFLYGLAVHELRQEELDVNDPDYPVTISVRAVKP